MTSRLALDRVPLITLPNWVKAASACGFSIESVFRELRVEADLVHLEQATISSRDLERIMGACVARARGRHFPLVLGQTFAFEYLPELETFLSTSATLRESLRVFEWLRVLVNPYLSMRLVEQGDGAALQLEDLDAGLSASGRWFTEATFVAVIKFGRALLRGRGDLRRACFRHSRPDYAAELEGVFALPVDYQQPGNRLEMDRRLLDLRLDGAFETLHRQAEQRVAQRLADRPLPVSVAADLERAMELDAALLGAGIEAAARALRLHPRALQRRLAAEKRSFAELQSGVRMRLARRWLAEGTLDVEAISDRLGFSDRRSFTRAFARAVGQTPSAYRQAHVSVVTAASRMGR